MPRRKRQRGGNVLESVQRGAEYIKDNRLISQGLGLAQQITGNPAVGAASNVASQVGLGMTRQVYPHSKQKGGNALRFAVMPPGTMPERQLIGSGQNGGSLGSILGGIASLPLIVGGTGILGAAQGLSAGISNIAGGGKKRRRK